MGTGALDDMNRGVILRNEVTKDLNVARAPGMSGAPHCGVRSFAPRMMTMSKSVNFLGRDIVGADLCVRPNEGFPRCGFGYVMYLRSCDRCTRQTIAGTIGAKNFPPLLDFPLNV